MQSSSGIVEIIVYQDGMTPIHIALRNVRKEAGLTQQEIADALGIKQPTVAGIEAGRATTTEIVEQWAALCGANVAIARPPVTPMATIDPALWKEALEAARVWARLPGPIRESMLASMRAIMASTG